MMINNKQNNIYNLSSTARRRGFTIVELLVVIVVIGILAAITIVSYSGISNRATISSMQSDLANASTTLKLDYVSNSTFPTTLASANGGKGITQSQTLDNIIYIPDNTSNSNNFCLQYRKGNNTYAIDNNSAVSSGVCLQNLVTNGDFSNGTTGWTGNMTVANNVLSVIGNGSNNYPFMTQSNTIIMGHKYYVNASARVTNSFCSQLEFKFDNNVVYYYLGTPIQNQWYYVTQIINATTTSMTFRIHHDYVDNATANGKVMQVKYVSVIDLTTTFGVGNEPTKAQMDIIMSNYSNSWFNIVAKTNI